MGRRRFYLSRDHAHLLCQYLKQAFLRTRNDPSRNGHAKTCRASVRSLVIRVARLPSRIFRFNGVWATNLYIHREKEASFSRSAFVVRFAIRYALFLSFLCLYVPLGALPCLPGGGGGTYHLPWGKMCWSMWGFAREVFVGRRGCVECVLLPAALLYLVTSLFYNYSTGSKGVSGAKFCFSAVVAIALCKAHSRGVLSSYFSLTKGCRGGLSGAVASDRISGVGRTGNRFIAIDDSALSLVGSNVQCKGVDSKSFSVAVNALSSL